MASPKKRTTDLPLSGQAKAKVPACIQALLLRAGSLRRDASLKTELEHLLDELVGLEAGAGAAVRVELPDKILVVKRRSTVEAVHHSDPPPTKELAADRLFPAIVHERIMVLPGSAKGTIHFATPSFDQARPERYDDLLQQAAGIVSLVIGLLAPAAQAGTPQNLAQLEKLATIGQTASQIVHELNNPLTAIIAYSDYLTRRLKDRDVDEGDIGRLHKINEAAVRIQRFCRELTDYSRPSGNLRSPVELHDVIDRALSFCVHGLRSANITVERVYRDAPLVLGNDTALTQVFVNLITNAWHAMESGGTLSIRTRTESANVVIEIADEGHGITDDDRERIFDAYFTTKDKGSGVGLGLSIVRQIIEEHRAAIHVKPREPHGTVFVITFRQADGHH